MRFHSARAAGLTEEIAEGIEDGYEDRFAPHEVAALQLTDAVIGNPHSLSDETRRSLAEHYTDEQVVEMVLGVGLFLGMSKVLINLGLEPEDMPVTVSPTPGSNR